MTKTFTVALLAIAIRFLPAATGRAAPKKEDPDIEKRNKAVKEFVAKVYDARGRQDFDALMELFAIPVLVQPDVEKHGDGSLVKDKAKLKKRFEKERDLSNSSKFDGSQHIVARIETYAEAKKRFVPFQVKDADHVSTSKTWSYTPWSTTLPADGTSGYSSKWLTANFARSADKMRSTTSKITCLVFKCSAIRGNGQIVDIRP